MKQITFFLEGESPALSVVLLEYINSISAFPLAIIGKTFHDDVLVVAIASRDEIEGKYKILIFDRKSVRPNL